MRGHIEGTEIYLSEDQLPAFTFSINSLSDPSKQSGNKSTTIRIISTPESKRILGTEFMAEVPRNARPVLRLVEGGTEVYNGNILPIDHSRNEIECVAVGGNALWFEYVKKFNLRSLDLGLTDSPLKPTMINSWTDEEAILYWPLIDYGLLEGQLSSFNVPHWVLRPAVRVHKALEYAMDGSGYRFIPMGSLVDKWKKFVILDSTDIKTAHYQGNPRGCTYACELFPASYALTDDGGAGTILPTINNYPPFASNPTMVLNGLADGSFDATSDAVLDIRVDGLGLDFVSTPPTVGENFYLNLYDVTAGAVIATLTKQYADNGTLAIRFYGEMTSVPVVNGQTYYLTVQRDAAGYAGPTNHSPVGIVTFNPQGQIYEPEYLPWSNPLVADINGVLNGSDPPIRINSAMPDTTVATILTGLAISQRLVFSTNQYTGIIQVWHESEYYKNPFEASETRDWSTRMDHTVAPKKKYGSYPRKIDFNWLIDEGDRDVSLLRKTTGTPGFANGSVEIPDAYGEPITVTAPFAATAMGNPSRTIGPPIVFIPLMRKQDGVFQVDDYDRSIRLLIADGTKTGNWYLDNELLTAYPKCYFYLETGDGIALPWDNVTAQYPLSIEANWQYYLDTIRNGRTLEADLFIRDHELQNFDHGMPTLVDDGSGPAWYYVVEIRNHRFGKNVPTRCTLIPLPNMEVAFDAIPVVPFVVPANPFVCAGPGYGSFTLTGGTSLGTVKTSTGYASTRSGSGDIVLHGGGNPDSFFDVNVGAEGSYCLWASNGLKEKIGTLTHIDNENSYVTALDINGYAGLLSIDFEDNVSFSALIFSGNPLLEFVQLLDYDGSILDFSDNSNLGQLRCGASVSLSTVILAALNPASFIDLSGCALTAATVNAILANAVANGMTGGTIDLSGGTSAAPTGQGILDAIYLVDILGNTVTTN